MGTAGGFILCCQMYANSHGDWNGGTFMDLDFFLQMMEDSGYKGLFFWVWLGTSSLPVPNEVIMMTIGLASSQKILNPFLIFIVTLAGVLAALNTSYLLGRYVGRPLIRFLEKRDRFASKIQSALKLMEKYHVYSLSISYFIPGLRSIVPFLYGFSKLSFKKFVLFSYTGATFWLLIMYLIGYLFGDHIERIMSLGKESVILVITAVLVLFVIYKITRNKKEPIVEEREMILQPGTLSPESKGKL